MASVWRVDSSCATASIGLAAALVAASTAGAQAPDARASLVTVTLSAEVVTVGEPFTVRVRVRAPKVATVTFPDVPGAADGVDPVDPRTMEEGPPGELLDRTAIYSFVAWDVGPRAPALGPVLISVAGQERAFPVAIPRVTVRSLLPADSAERVPRDPRAPVPLPGRLGQYIVLGTVLAGLLAWLWRRRARHGAAKGRAEPEAWVAAREGFAAVDALGLVEAGEPGRHVIAHVDVLREYVGRRFPDLGASLDATTFLTATGDADFPISPKRIEALIARDAALRFAHSAVAADEAAALAVEARDIVAQVQLAHEARLRAIERPPRPRRR